MANKHIKRGSTKCKLKPQCDITTHLSERIEGSVWGVCLVVLIVIRPDAGRMRRKRITSTWLVGMESGPATLETSRQHL